MAITYREAQEWYPVSFLSEKENDILNMRRNKNPASLILERYKMSMVQLDNIEEDIKERLTCGF